MTRSWRGSCGLLLMSAAPAVALSRLLIHGLRPGVVGPMVLAIVVADRGTALVMRFRLPLVPAIAVGALLSVLALLVGFDPSLVNPASLHFADWSTFSSQFRSARYALVNDGTPLPALVGVVVALGALGGLAAAATRAIWESQLRRELGAHGHVGPLTGCIAPSLGVFVYSTLVSANHGRVPAALAYFGGVAVFVALADRSGPSFGPRRTMRRLPVGAVVGCALVLVVVLVAGAGLAGMRLSVFHVTPPAGSNLSGASGPTSPSQLLTGTALVDDLRTSDIEESDAVIFRARSEVPTYWQVGTLTTFNGTEWLPGRGVEAALAGAAGASASSLDASTLPVPEDGLRFNASVRLTDFASRLLPAPPHTVSVEGLDATPVGQEGVLAAQTSVTGTSYSVTAELPPVHPANAQQLDLHDPRLAPYLALPAEPAIVPFLAHAVVGQDATQGAQVQALVNWFRSGRFRYTLDPPSVSGSNPLVQFLTVTRAGYCQQFAGAFGILARSLGIPTRLVVGFVAGQPGPDDSFTVTGSDAHVWPQVYLGPGTGWISVEPTPPAPTNTAAPAGVVGPTQPPATSSTTPTASGGAASGHSGGGSSRATSGSRATTPPHATGTSWVELLAIIAAIAAVLAAAFVLWRRRRPGVRSDGPNQRIVQTWEHAHRALARRGLARGPAETPAEYAARLGRLEQQGGRRVAADALAHLAALVELACYAPGPCTLSQVDAAQGWGSAVSEALRRR
jgi:hypothetical protein